jgi:hypothetical protein
VGVESGLTWQLVAASVRHNGRFEVEAEFGRGHDFTVVLPAQRFEMSPHSRFGTEFTF